MPSLLLPVTLTYALVLAGWMVMNSRLLIIMTQALGFAGWRGMYGSLLRNMVSPQLLQVTLTQASGLAG